MTLSKPFSDEIFHGLPKPEVKTSLNSLLFDDQTSARKYNRGATINLSSEMYQAMQEAVAHRDLPFEGNMSMLGRHAIGAFLEAVDSFLDDDSRTLFTTMMRQQRRLTRERYVVTVEDLLNQEVELLRFWTAKSKWAEVVRGLTKFLHEVEDYPVAEWREFAANVFLRNEGVRVLIRTWEETMKEDSPDSWRKVRAVHERMERLAGIS